MITSDWHHDLATLRGLNHPRTRRRAPRIPYTVLRVESGRPIGLGRIFFLIPSMLHLLRIHFRTFISALSEETF